MTNTVSRLKIFRINLTEHVKDAFPNILQIVRLMHCGYWNISFERELLTTKKRQRWNAFCHLTHDHIIVLCLLWWKSNKTLFLLQFLQNYNTFPKHKMLNISFLHLFIYLFWCDYNNYFNTVVTSKSVAITSTWSCCPGYYFKQPSYKIYISIYWTRCWFTSVYISVYKKQVLTIVSSLTLKKFLVRTWYFISHTYCTK